MRILLLLSLLLLSFSIYSKEFKFRSGRGIYRSLERFHWNDNVEFCTEEENCSINISEGICVLFPFGSENEIDDANCNLSYTDNHVYGPAKVVRSLFTLLRENHIDTIVNNMGTIFFFFDHLNCSRVKRKYSCTIEIKDENLKI